MPSDRLCRFARVERETPCAVLDLEMVEQAYDRYVAALGGRGRVQFAVKARPHGEVLAALVRRGASLDVASTAEVRLALAAGCAPERLSHSNVVRNEREIAEAFALGVRTFCADSAGELARLRRWAPGAQVLLRLACASAGADVPMTAQFGCDTVEAVELARGSGLAVAGLTWHVGSQQTDPAQWEVAIEQAARVWTALERAGVGSLRVLNVGGGMPATYRRVVPSIADCADTVFAAIDTHFGGRELDVVFEPGRGLVAAAGAVVAGVKSVVERGGLVHVVLDAGVWNAGLVECLLSGIEYPVDAIDHPADAPVRDVVLCGPSCDPLDELRVATPYRLPVALAPGDRLLIGSTGAYCATMTAADFCGYPALPVHVLPARAMEVSR